MPGYGAHRGGATYWKDKAIEMLLTADMVDAEEAYRLGLVTHVVESGDEVTKSLEIL